MLNALFVILFAVAPLFYIPEAVEMPKELMNEPQKVGQLKDGGTGWVEAKYIKVDENS